MSESFARVVLAVAGGYLGAGVLFAGPFVVRGIQRIDPAAQGSTWGFRTIIVPGVVLLWPLLAWRWARGSVHPPTEITAHRRLAAARGGRS